MFMVLCQLIVQYRYFIWYRKCV